MPNQNTSWANVCDWYQKEVGEGGHYYHQHVVIPNSLRLLHPPAEKWSLLDLGCGQGVLERAVAASAQYCGVDIAPNLLSYAREHQKHTASVFVTADAAKPLPPKITANSFTHAACILALQNIRHPEGVLQNAARALKTDGTLLLVMNHPCFRIPRQSSWGIDESKKVQYRRLDLYLSEMDIPVTAHPGQKQSAVTWSFHKPLMAYFAMLHAAGFAVTQLEEWSSDKKSEGKAAKMENRSRQEFPLFLALVARKIA